MSSLFSIVVKILMLCYQRYLLVAQPVAVKVKWWWADTYTRGQKYGNAWLNMAANSSLVLNPENFTLKMRESHDCVIIIQNKKFMHYSDWTDRGARSTGAAEAICSPALIKIVKFFDFLIALPLICCFCRNLWKLKQPKKNWKDLKPAETTWNNLKGAVKIGIQAEMTGNDLLS